MIYIIDANNLAGKLHILDEPDFDKDLIALINNWIGEKKHKAHLVFDGVDIMGEKFPVGKVNVIYAPKDSHYQSADDKIIELVDELALVAHEKIILVTDDAGIIAKVLERQNLNRYKHQILFEKATLFAEYLHYSLEAGDDRGDEQLDDNTVDKINKELSALWK